MDARNLATDQKKGFKSGVVFGFFDESGFADKPHVVKSWGLRGQTPVIRSRGGWRRITAAGMISLNTKSKRTMALAWLSKRGMRKEKLIGILKDIKRHYSRKRFVLLWDGLPAHKAKIVQVFIKENASWLTVYRFPAYSPELNPQEYMWSAVKRKDMGNYCPRDFIQLRSKVYRSLKGRKSKQSFLRGCLKASGLLSAKELGEG